MNNLNDIGISRQLDWPRIRKLLTIGLIASVMHFIGDMLLGWGAEDETLNGFARMLSAYTSTSDVGILTAVILGLTGMTLEGLCCVGIYRLMAEQSPKYAHSYRTGIFGFLIFGVCGFHVPVCALVFLTKHGLGEKLILQYIFFAVLEITQIKAFAKGLTPYHLHPHRLLCHIYRTDFVYRSFNTYVVICSLNRIVISNTNGTLNIATRIGAFSG